MTDVPQSFEERRRKLLEARNKPLPEVPPEDIPDFDEPKRTDPELDAVISSIDILTAYRKWCGKKIDEKTTNQREGVKVSCPNPDHRDENPSAWLNLDKGTYYCGGCQQGGDKYDIAAYHFGYAVPGYKTTDFPKLRRQIAEDLGYTIKQVVGGTLVIPPPTLPAQPDLKTDKSDKPHIPDKTDISDEADMVSSEPEGDDDSEDEDELIVYPTIDWKSIVPEDTFLRAYLEECSRDDSPEEYHFWNGLLALGHAAGRNVTLDDSPQVFGNLLVCLMGGTGFGKSKSERWLHQVIRRVMPFDPTGTAPKGVKTASVPASGEYLIKQFQHQIRDPGNPKIVLGNAPVNGIIAFDELAGLVGRANRQGNTLKSTVMGFADARERVTTGSLTHGDLIAIEPFCSITATTQPRAMRSLLSRTDAGSGFLNRWIFVGGPKKETEVLGGSHSLVTINLDKACDLLGEVYGWSGFRIKVTLDHHALEYLTIFFRNIVFPIKEKDQSDVLKRLDLLFKKLILLFAINEKKKVVDADLVKRVSTLLNYLLDCYRILDLEVSKAASSEMTGEILRHLERHFKKYDKGATARDLNKYMSRKQYGLEQVQRMLETLLKLDMIEAHKPAGVGRPTVRYTVVNDES